MRPVQNVELAAQSHENEPRDGGATLEAYVWKPFNRLDIDPRIALTDQKLVAELLTSAWLPRSDSDASVESSLKELFTSITETCDPSKRHRIPVRQEARASNAGGVFLRRVPPGAPGYGVAVGSQR
ncbi:hypothetical protein DIPPA_07969 [Diplonema papillatum]|nr:hypothetical protein DIPPA_07969 [Diplonema papillatum]